MFYKNKGPYRLLDIASAIKCDFDQKNADILINEVKSLSDAQKGDITFLNNKKYIEEYKKTKASACIVTFDFEEENSSDMIILRVSNPYHAYAKIIDLFYSYGKNLESKISPTAYVSKTAKIGKNCYIGHNVVIEDEVEIGDNAIIESGTVIDYAVKIGKNARIDSNVSISHSIIGDDLVVLPGAVIGSDGFGFSTEEGVHKKIYHIGKVIIGNDVEIGTNSCIDRGSTNNTIIEDMCRIDNLVQVAHNVHVKKGTILAAQVGIAGSSTIGEYCAFGGQVGVAGHINITDKVHISGQGGVIQNIPKSGIMGGTPSVPIRDWHKQTIIMRKLIKEK